MFTRRGMAAVAAVLLAAAALLSACSGDSDKPGTSASQDPGRPLQTLAADGLPADFPRDEVPIVDGEVTSVQEGDEKDPGYAIAVLVDGDVTAALANAVQLLEGAGWQTSSGNDSSQVAVLTNDGGQVVVTGAPTDDQSIISYAINVG